MTFEQRPSLPTSIWLPIDPIPDDVDDLLLNYRKVKIPVGEDEDGRRIWWHRPGSAGADLRWHRVG